MIVLLYTNNDTTEATLKKSFFCFGLTRFNSIFKLIQYTRNYGDTVSAIIFDVNHSDALSLSEIIYKNNIPSNIPRLLVLEKELAQKQKRNLLKGWDDILSADKIPPVMDKRIAFLKNLSLYRELKKNDRKKNANRKISLKRPFDIVFSSIVLLLISPLLLLISILIKLDSKGPVFYTSKRVGTNYRVFNFYKFRTMRINADSLLKDLKKDNQYAKDAVNTQKTAHKSDARGAILYADNEVLSENEFLNKKNSESNTSFIKISNDPRVTKLGSFLRNTSLDELPQLFNVLKGDMSVVGNRPLPMYEAETLTEDKWIARFLAPAGITGLWQVEKRAQSSEMSPEERKSLDVEYAKDYSVLKDFKIIFRTLPALIQKEKV